MARQKRRGRPDKLNDALKDELIKVIRSGNYIETACAYVGINKTSFYDWLRKGAREKERIENNPRASVTKDMRKYVDFHTEIEKALAYAEIRDVAIIAKAAQKNWQASAWRLERKFPDRWGRKDKVDADIKHEGSIDVRAEYRNMSKEELERLANRFDIDE